MNVYKINPMKIDQVKVVPWRGAPGASGDYAGLLNKPSINSVTLQGNKSLADLGIASTSDLNEIEERVDTAESSISSVETQVNGLTASSGALVNIGGAPLQNVIYLEEGNASGSSLFFKIINSLNIFGSTRYFQRSWNNIKNDLNATPVTTPNGMTDCIEVPNNTALVFDYNGGIVRFVDRLNVKQTQVPLFVNSYGRAENLHPTIIGAKLFALEQIIVNVQKYGAKGDGSTNDTLAIQTAIEQAKNKGGIVFFPKGTYLLSTALFNASDTSIASALMCYSGQTLKGDNATLKVGSASVTHTIFTYNASDATGYDGCEGVTIEGITFDGNSSLSNNITHINISHGQNVRIKECSFVNGRAWHSIELNSSKNVKVENCLFYDNANTEDIQIDSASGNGNLGSDDGTVCEDIEISGCGFTVNGYPAIGNHTNASHLNIKIHDNVFSGNGGSSGYISFVSSQTKTDVYDNTFKASTKGVTFANTSNGGSVRDNRFIDVTTPHSGGVIEYNNIINDVVKSVFSDNGFTFPKTVSDLNTVMTMQSIGSIVMVQYSNTATSNRPSNDSGICLSGRNTGSGAYGWQIAFTNNGFYWRKYSGGSFQSWAALT